VPVGTCTGLLSFPPGPVTITEAPVSGTAVTGITASGSNPTTGATDNRLVGSSLDNRSATVNIVAGGASTVTVARFTNTSVPAGYVEVCKESSVNPPVSGNFSFNVSGAAANPYIVPAGACTGPIKVQAGSVTVTELPREGYRPLDVYTIPANRLMFKNIPAGSAVVNAVGGDVSTQTVVVFKNTPSDGQLKLCKIAGEGIAIGQTFTISSNGVSYSVPAGPASTGGYCVLDGTFPVGTVVTIQETIPPGVQVTGIAVEPPDRVTGAPNLTNGTAMVTVGTGFTEITFTNALRPQGVTGSVAICKVAGTGVSTGTNFNFTVVASSGSSRTVTVPAGPASQGGFCVDAGNYPLDTRLTVSEAVPPGGSVAGITVAPPDRGSSPAGNTVQVTVGAGATTVTYTNRAAAGVTTTALPAFEAGVFYSLRLTADGGVGPYTWSIESGRLPRGVRLNSRTGEISGVPEEEAGELPIVFKVVDSSSSRQSGSGSFEARRMDGATPRSARKLWRGNN
jgi:hypothetical protein